MDIKAIVDSTNLYEFYVRILSSELSDGRRDFLAIPVVKLRNIDSVRDGKYEISLSMRRVMRSVVTLYICMYV
jgi:hypothetical protein